MSHTKKNLREVDDSAPEFGFGETQEAHFANADLDVKNTGVSYHVLRPGKRQGFAHRHEDAEEVYVILAGNGRLKLDDDVIEVSEMDAIRVAPTVARAFQAGDDGIEYIAFGALHEGDGELIREAFWND
jgi:mannose-6-phosphate isomerase-like protein (cupin superfamily)